jgi:hypothetical protein
MNEFFTTAIPNSTRVGNLSSNRETSIMEDKCPCMIAENSKCIDCGEPIMNPEFTVEKLAEEGIVLGSPLPPDAPVPNIGNISGLIHLAQNTFREGVHRQVENTDPKNPKLPRLRMIDAMLFRVPHTDIWNGLLRQSFEQAQAMGFRGTLERWGTVVEDIIPPNVAES